MEKEKNDLAELTATVISLFPKLDPEEQEVSVQLYRLLAGGLAVPRERIAETLHFSEDFVNSILSRWFGVYYDGEGRVIGYWGLALPRMAHRFEVNGQTLYTWCAWEVELPPIGWTVFDPK